MRRKRIVIVQRTLPHYRTTFFRELQRTLDAQGVELNLLYGREKAGEVPRSVSLAAPWAMEIENRYFRIGSKQLVWQRCWRDLGAADLVVVEHAARLTLNYLLLARAALGRGPGLAFWGHGRNFQEAQDRHLAASVKGIIAKRALWWFAYTELSASELRNQGVPSDRVTVVNNSIDTTELRTAFDAVTLLDREVLRQRLGIPSDAPVGLYCGGLHPGKQIAFLLEASRAIRARNPLFELVVIGDGPELPIVQAAAAQHEWIHAVGPVFGPERAGYFGIANALLMPAHVGLVIVDSFVTGIPLFATVHATHSPEIAYLVPNVNGVMTAYDADAYADAVTLYLCDTDLQQRLRAGCATSAQEYTLERMVERFSGGVLAALAT